MTFIDFAVSVTTKRTSTPDRFRLPGTTMPPMRNVRPTGASFAATCEGVKKNTRFWLNAVRTSAVAMPSAATPAAIHAIRLCLGFTLPLQQQCDFDREQGESDAIRTPDLELVHCASAISQRSRVSATAMLFAQKHSAIRIMPINIVAAMLGALLKLTDAP